MPGQHVLPLLSLRVAHSSGQLHLSSSSFVAKAGRPVDTYGHKAAAKARFVRSSQPSLITCSRPCRPTHHWTSHNL